MTHRDYVDMVREALKARQPCTGEQICAYIRMRGWARLPVSRANEVLCGPLCHEVEQNLHHKWQFRKHRPVGKARRSSCAKGARIAAVVAGSAVPVIKGHVGRTGVVRRQHGPYEHECVAHTPGCQGRANRGLGIARAEPLIRDVRVGDRRVGRCGVGFLGNDAEGGRARRVPGGSRTGRGRHP